MICVPRIPQGAPSICTVLSYGIASGTAGHALVRTLAIQRPSDFKDHQYAFSSLAMPATVQLSEGPSGGPARCIVDGSLVAGSRFPRPLHPSRQPTRLYPAAVAPPKPWERARAAGAASGSNTASASPLGPSTAGDGAVKPWEQPQGAPRQSAPAASLYPGCPISSRIGHDSVSTAYSSTVVELPQCSAVPCGSGCL